MLLPSSLFDAVDMIISYGRQLQYCAVGFLTGFSLPLRYASVMPDKQTTPREQQLLELGRMLEKFYEMGYTSPKKALVFSLLKGIASGAGAFIGGTLVIGLLLWGLSMFDELPFINLIIESLQNG